MGIEDLTQENLEAAVLHDLGAEFKQSVDYEMEYWLMLKFWAQQGWTEVKLSRFQDNKHAVDISWWLHYQGLKDVDDYYRSGREFVFRDAKMATAFTLRWA